MRIGLFALQSVLFDRTSIAYGCVGASRWPFPWSPRSAAAFSERIADSGDYNVRAAELSLMSSSFRLDFTADEPPEATVIAGFPGPGMAAVSANQYLIEQMDLEQNGHIHAEGLPAITPYENGRPYHPTRLFSTDELPVTVLTSELPVPVQLSEPFGRVLLDWIEDRDVKEVTLLTTIPQLDSGKSVSYVASEDYVDHRLTDTPFEPLTGGFLTGVNAGLIDRAIDTELRVGVIATGVHPYRPLDPEATLRLVDAMMTLYGFDVDVEQLREFAGRMRQHYEELTEQIEAQDQTQQRTRGFEDYGFM